MFLIELAPLTWCDALLSGIQTVTAVHFGRLLVHKAFLTGYPAFAQLADKAQLHIFGTILSAKCWM